MSSLERSALASAPAKDFPPESQILANLQARRFSCRAFKPDEVPDKVIDRMLTIAQMSASWCNTQPWQVTVTSGAATERFRQALIDEVDSSVPYSEPDFTFPTTYSGVRLDRRREVGWQLYESAGIQKGDREGSAKQARENERLFGAPHVLLIHTSRELGVYGALDCGVYLGTLLLAAESLGLGIIPQAALAMHTDLIRSHFAVPEDSVFVVGASFGYADLANPVNGFRSRRAALSECVSKVRD